ncbi:hypothetical protein MBM_03603 [Drepanopeziza brunnea f. sp. 'multigermtubi' MB_m1]|uniref:Uncharacterized protein n=1 Tax=Marssonina brunnea f. sp. multigermtubi (strain MB_m1) TaxID=1072389 RepID=K1WLM3_MARBU|nr:uncharacterized protein MBM_03603 [Drepanopeziza brunnea f. sp. 'multigermtubi' MB_m1]EKD18610.1 hypothetical protein MBM_03603 [Drepanopeziza brunnea f. sp. 'multigermtubi' MB_m1]
MSSYEDHGLSPYENRSIRVSRRATDAFSPAQCVLFSDPDKFNNTYAHVIQQPERFSGSLGLPSFSVRFYGFLFRLFGSSVLPVLLVFLPARPTDSLRPSAPFGSSKPPSHGHGPPLFRRFNRLLNTQVFAARYLQLEHLQYAFGSFGNQTKTQLFGRSKSHPPACSLQLPRLASLSIYPLWCN